MIVLFALKFALGTLLSWRFGRKVAIGVMAALALLLDRWLIPVALVGAWVVVGVLAFALAWVLARDGWRIGWFAGPLPKRRDGPP